MSRITQEELEALQHKVFVNRNKLEVQLRDNFDLVYSSESRLTSNTNSDQSYNFRELERPAQIRILKIDILNKAEAFLAARITSLKQADSTNAADTLTQAAAAAERLITSATEPGHQEYKEQTANFFKKHPKGSATKRLVAASVKIAHDTITLNDSTNLSLGGKKD